MWFTNWNLPYSLLDQPHTMMNLLFQSGWICLCLSPSLKFEVFGTFHMFITLDAVNSATVVGHVLQYPTSAKCFKNWPRRTLIIWIVWVGWFGGCVLYKKRCNEACLDWATYTASWGPAYRAGLSCGIICLRSWLICKMPHAALPLGLWGKCRTAHQKMPHAPK